MNRQRVFMIAGLLFVLGLLVAMPVGTAQATTEICNNKVDDDGDKAVDCADPDCATSEFCKTPPPPPKNPADCSPGFYKKHPNTWDDGVCATGSYLVAGTQANQLFLMLSAELGATAAQRAAAKNLLDACFETAEESPCEDDD
jgi:hypothetical protein